MNAQRLVRHEIKKPKRKAGKRVLRALDAFTDWIGRICFRELCNLL